MSDIPPPPAGFTLDAPSKRKRGTGPAVDTVGPPPIGDDIVVRPLDGDTLRLRSGRDLRLWGIDAPESHQQGWDRNGNPVPIGQEATGTLKDLLTQGTPTFGDPVGTSYGRTVGPLDVGGNDVGLSMLNRGEAFAEPNYITGDPQRRYDYVQAERLARQNFQGVHRTYNRPPAEFRHNPSYVPSREEVAQFWDTPTPNAGLSKEDEQAYIALAHTGTAQQLIDFATAHGAKIDPDEARQFVANRDKGVGVLDKVYYRDAPKLLTDPGDGRTGPGARGVSNGVLFNQLEELGAGVDTMGLTPGRENVWNSDRRLADIYANNLAQNEAVTGFDQAFHPYVYHGGELAGSLVVPMARVRSAADLAKWGAAYGGLTGLGQPGTIPERLTSGVVGAGAGAATTILGTRALEAATPVVSRWLGKKGEMAADAAVGVAEGLSDDIPPPPDGFAVNGPDGRPARVPDRIDVGPSAPAPEAPRESINTANPGPVQVNPKPAAPAFAPDLTPRRPLRENHLGPLSDHAPRFWRETSPDKLELFLPSGNATNDVHSTGDLYMSDHPDLALGQGQNRGVSMEFDAANLQGRVSREKPTADLGYEQGAGSEYVARHNRASDYKGALRSVRIAEDAHVDKITASRLRGALGRLEQQGWRRTEGDGFVQYDRPDIVAAEAGPTSRDRDWLDIAGIPPPPNGYRLNPPGNDNSPIASSLEEVRLMSRRPMASEADAAPSVSQDMRRPDYLDVSGAAQARRLTDPLSREQMERVANDIQPRDLVPIPSNEVGSVEEAAAKDAGRYVEAKPVDETTALASRTVTSQNGRELKKRGPLDLVTWLRSQGGIRDQGGELRAMGIDNAPRDMDLARGEQRLGKLVNDQGMSLDDAAMKAWEAGYLPGNERPDINTLLDAIDKTHSGADRYFHPDDLHEVEQFHGMRQDRQALETQLADGPVHVDRSVPAGPDQPFAPPEAHEDWPSGGPDFAGNIRLEKLNTPQDIKRALATTEKRVGFDASTRGRVTQAETERLASELNMTPEQLLSRRKGQALNAEEALAARQILAKSGNELVNAARKVQALENPGDELLAEFQQKLVRHAALQEQVAGATAEAGRALQQFRMVADSRNVRGEVLASLINRHGGADRVKQAAETLLETVEQGPGKFNVLAEKLSKPRWRDKALELWINSLLSGPQTHAVNFLSNTMTALGQLPEHAIAAGIGKGREIAMRKQVDRVLMSEVGARAVGMMQGAKEGMALAAHAFRTGDPADVVTRLEGQANKNISGLKGEIIRLPTRALTASDELFKGIARRMELTGLAHRQAAKEGLTGEAAAQRIAGLIENPPDDMMAKAMDYARYVTFQRPLGPAGANVSGFLQNMPAFKLFAPFVRTPANLLKFAVERSPAAPLLREWRKDFAAGGARRDLAIAKAMVGTGVGMSVYQLAREGYITGSGPADQGARQILWADGWQPYSIRVGDKYISYQRLDPFSTTLGVAATLADLGEYMTDKQKDRVATLLVASVLQNLSSKTWLSGISSISEATTDPDRYADGLVERLAGSVAVPALFAQVARTVDPVQREVDGVADAVKARIPYLSKTLPAKRDIWGKPVVSEGGIGPDIISPLWVSTRKNDPVNKALLEAGVHVGTPDKTIGDRQMTPEEWGKFREGFGSLAHSRIAEMIRSPEWKSLDRSERKEKITDAFRDARKETKSAMFGEEAKPASRRKSEPALDGPPPLPPGYSITGEAGGRNVYADLLRTIPGLTEDNLTSGFRTPAYQDDMKRRGYHPADNSGHLDGSSFDITVPAGRSMGWLMAQVKRYDPKARLLPEGDHLHTTFPGYYGAPALGGARGAGLANPLAGMPPPPPGFTVNAR